MIGEVLLLSLIAGSATVIGGILVILLPRISDRFVAGSMGFASGVMLLRKYPPHFVAAPLRRTDGWEQAALKHEREQRAAQPYRRCA